MQLIQNISMDFAVHGITPKVFGKQDDSGSMRTVAISLFSAGAAYPLSENTGFMLRYKTAAGAIGLYDALPDGTSAFSVDGNTVTVALVDQIFAKPGNVECELRVVEPAGVISTWTWIVEVERSNVGDASIPSDYINVLSGYASTAIQAAAEAKTAAKSIDPDSIMKISNYDPNDTVRDAGGIASYIGQRSVENEIKNDVVISFPSVPENCSFSENYSVAYQFGRLLMIHVNVSLNLIGIKYLGGFDLDISVDHPLVTNFCIANGAFAHYTEESGVGYRAFLTTIVSYSNVVHLIFYPDGMISGATGQAGDRINLKADVLLLLK